MISYIGIEFEFFVAVKIKIGIFADRFDVSFIKRGRLLRLLGATTAAATTAATAATVTIARFAFFIARFWLAAARLAEREIRAFRLVVIEDRAGFVIVKWRLFRRTDARLVRIILV